MRGLILTLFFFGSLPWMLYRPFVGLMFWVGFGYLNPHRLTFGFAQHFPFVMIASIATLLAFVVSREQKRVPWNGVTAVWLLWTAWTCITTLFALNPEAAVVELSRFLKIQVMTLMLIVLLTDRKRIEVTVWVIVGSIAFYGVKGGVFTLLSGGAYYVLGPDRTFIGGSNEIAFAMIIVLPLLWYLWQTSDRRWLRWGLVGVAGLCIVSIMGSQSRGAFLALVAMLGALWLKSPGKGVTGTLGVIAILVGLLFMPDEWMERMRNIPNYQDDLSALGRLNAWGFALNLAADHPIVGGGFRTFTPELFMQYAPWPDKFHDAHSIFFEVLAEQGYVGLVLFVLLGLLTLLMAARTIRICRGREDLRWAARLSAMVQVGVVGYVVGGMFLGLAYFDLPYSLMAIVVATHVVAVRVLRGEPAAPPAAGAAPDTHEVEGLRTAQ